MDYGLYIAIFMLSAPIVFGIGMIALIHAKKDAERDNIFFRKINREC